MATCVRRHASLLGVEHNSEVSTAVNTIDATIGINSYIYIDIDIDNDNDIIGCNTNVGRIDIDADTIDIDTDTSCHVNRRRTDPAKRNGVRSGSR